jgi:hypothetical protein
MRTAVQSGAKNCESGGGRPAPHAGFIARVSCSLHGCAFSHYSDPTCECRRRSSILKAVLTCVKTSSASEISNVQRESK